MNVRKKLFKLSGLLLLLFTGAVLGLYFYNPSVTIESFESKTTKGHPVFNKIQFYPGYKQDVWVMRQSHEGFKYPETKWDEIKIIVKKNKRPYIITYQQLENNKEIEFKASCYTCHANGPRVIRPEYGSPVVKYSIKDKINIQWMNLRIKAYGRTVIQKDNYKLNGNFRKSPLKFFGKNDSQPLQIKTCMKCHNSDSFFGRGELLKQHKSTIEHLTTNKQMPPWPFELGKEERKQIEMF